MRGGIGYEDYAPLADAIRKHGLNVAELSRVMGIHAETLRYRIRRNLLRHLTAVVNYGAFGLTPMWLDYGPGKYDFDAMGNPYVRMIEKTSDGHTYFQ